MVDKKMKSQAKLTGLEQLYVVSYLHFDLVTLSNQHQFKLRSQHTHRASPETSKRYVRCGARYFSERFASVAAVVVVSYTTFCARWEGEDGSSELADWAVCRELVHISHYIRCDKLMTMCACVCVCAARMCVCE